jgi:hypothetical protein
MRVLGLREDRPVQGYPRAFSSVEIPRITWHYTAGGWSAVSKEWDAVQACTRVSIRFRSHFVPICIMCVKVPANTQLFSARQTMYGQFHMMCMMKSRVVSSYDIVYSAVSTPTMIVTNLICGGILKYQSS